MSEGPAVVDIQFCQPHWDSLKGKVEEEGMSALISDDGEELARRMAREADSGERTIDSFDPLWDAHGAIVDNALRILGPFNGCPICELNKAHDEGCEDPNCVYQGTDAYDRFLDYAVADAKETWGILQEVGRL